MRETNEPEHWVQIVPPMNSTIFTSTQQYMWKCKCGDWDDGFETRVDCVKAANGHLLHPESSLKYPPNSS